MSSVEAVRKIEKELQKDRCQLGFALHHFPSNLPEEKHLEKMLSKKYGPDHPFSKFKAVFLNVGKEDPQARMRQGKPNLDRDTPDYDPFDPLNKLNIARHFTIGTGNWGHERTLFMDHFTKTRRGMTEIDALKPSREAAQDILRAVHQPSVE